MNSNCSNLLDMRNLQEQVKKHSVAKNYSDLSLFKQIVVVISKILQILGLQPGISKVFLDHKNNVFSQYLGQNNTSSFLFFLFSIMTYFLEIDIQNKVVKIGMIGT